MKGARAHEEDRLLLCTYDELMLLWDALMLSRLSLSPGDPDHNDVVLLLERVGELMSSSLL